MAKAKKSKSRKSKAKKSTKKKARPARRAAAKSARPAKRKKASARKPKAKKAAPKKPKQTMGEGDYAASKSFLKDQAEFVKRNKAKIPAMGKEAEQALEGPEGDNLRAAEQEAMNRSTID